MVSNTTSSSEIPVAMSSYGGNKTIKTNLPDYPNTWDFPRDTWTVGMNYLMPFSVILLILCMLLLIMCYLRHRIRQRQMLQREFRILHLMRSNRCNFELELDPVVHGASVSRTAILYPPTYEEALTRQDANSQCLHGKGPGAFANLPPSYMEALQSQSNCTCNVDSVDSVNANNTVVNTTTIYSSNRSEQAPPNYTASPEQN